MSDLAKKLASLPETLNKEIQELVPKCPNCGRPTGGFMRPGQTPSQAGICDCPKEVA